MRYRTSGSACWIVLIGCAFLLSGSNADARERLSYWIEVIGGWTTGSGFTLLDPSETIQLAFTVLNDEESQDLVVLGEGFFRRVAIELVDPESGAVVATVSAWRDTGSCAGVPNCPVDVSMTLAPAEIARFEVLLSTPDKQPPDLGVRNVRIALGEARQRIFAPDGSVWSGSVGEGGSVPLVLRRATSAEDFRNLESQELSAALRRGDHSHALRIYERRIARDPSDAGAHGGAGRSLAALGRLTEAAAAYERALARGSGSPVLPDLLTIVYFALGEDSKALAMLRRNRPEVEAQRAAEKELRQLAARLTVR